MMRRGRRPVRPQALGAFMSVPNVSLRHPASWNLGRLARGDPTRPKPKEKILDPHRAAQLGVAADEGRSRLLQGPRRLTSAGAALPQTRACLLDFDLGVRPSQLNANTLGRPSYLERF